MLMNVLDSQSSALCTRKRRAFVNNWAGLRWGHRSKQKRWRRHTREIEF